MIESDLMTSLSENQQEVKELMYDRKLEYCMCKQQRRYLGIHENLHGVLLTFSARGHI